MVSTFEVRKVALYFLSRWTLGSIHIQSNCVKISPLGQTKSGLITQVTSYKWFNSYEHFYVRTRKMWPLNTSDCLIDVTLWTGLSVYSFIYINWELYTKECKSGISCTWRSQYWYTNLFQYCDFFFKIVYNTGIPVM